MDSSSDKGTLGKFLSAAEVYNRYIDGGVCLLCCSVSGLRWQELRNVVYLADDDETVKRVDKKLRRMWTPREKAIIFIGEDEDYPKDLPGWISTMQLKVYVWKKGTGEEDLLQAMPFLRKQKKKLRLFSRKKKETKGGEQPEEEEEDALEMTFGVLPHRIRRHLFLGDYQASKNPLLLTMGVSHVVNAAGKLPNGQPRSGMTYLKIELDDLPGEPLFKHFAAVIDFVEKCRKQDKACLIHCAAGISRSATLVVAYLMATERLSLKEAYQQVKEIRRIISPNQGFAEQLRHWEKTLNVAPTLSIPSGAQKEESDDDTI